MMMLRRISTLGALLFLALGGCGRDRSASTGVGKDGAVAPGPLVLLLDAPAAVRAGDEVPVAVTLVNRGAAPASIPGVQPDLVVTHGDGVEVWRRSRHDSSPPPAATALRPNEMRGTGYSWSQRDDAGLPVPPGTYRIRAEAPALKLVSAGRILTIRP
jgi:hypothetical protein